MNRLAGVADSQSHLALNSQNPEVNRWIPEWAGLPFLFEGGAGQRKTGPYGFSALGDVA